mmetsp:Transcript_32811/g.103878  ORF Transcript_32811/g.103878 Transcript_32811/m.103878 type:complete len:205 (-) Transcript_32811:1879-2493(-)
MGLSLFSLSALGFEGLDPLAGGVQPRVLLAHVRLHARAVIVELAALRPPRGVHDGADPALHPGGVLLRRRRERVLGPEVPGAGDLRHHRRWVPRRDGDGAHGLRLEQGDAPCLRVRGGVEEEARGGVRGGEIRVRHHAVVRHARLRKEALHLRLPRPVRRQPVLVRERRAHAVREAVVHVELRLRDLLPDLRPGIEHRLEAAHR